MRKFLGSLVIVAMIIGGIGFYRGWFSVSKDDQPGETKVELRIDKEKVKADADEVARRAGDLRGGGEEQAPGDEPSERVLESAPAGETESPQDGLP